MDALSKLSMVLFLSLTDFSFHTTYHIASMYIIGISWIMRDNSNKIKESTSRFHIKNRNPAVHGRHTLARQLNHEVCKTWVAVVLRRRRQQNSYCFYCFYCSYCCYMNIELPTEIKHTQSI